MGAHLERGRVLYQQSRYEDALTELVRELAEDPQSVESHGLSALALSQLGRGEEALAAAGRAIAADPEDDNTHFVRAKVLYDLDREDDALAAIVEAIRIDPEKPPYHALHSALLYDQGKANRALRCAERGLAIDPQHVACLNLRSMALTKLGRRDEAHEGLETALAADPDSSLSHANRGWTYLHSGEVRAALEHFSEALRLDPANEWARGGLIEALKARNPIYRAILGWYLFSDRISARARWALILGLMFGARALRNVLREHERLAPLAAVVGLAYMSLIYLSWVAVPLFNLLLFLDKLGRHALSREQRTSALFFGGSLLLALALAGLDLAFGFPAEGAILGVAGLALGIPVAAVSQMDGGLRRNLGLGFVVAVAAALLFAALLKPIGLDAESPVPIAIAGGAFLACLLSTWVFGLTERG